MQTANDCLEKAMFIASESYSGSTYEMAFFRAMDQDCDEAMMMAPVTDAVNLVAMAA